jgi:peptide/nickel transport system permease protein
MRYIIRRTLQSIFLALGISITVFFLLRVIPGEPFSEIYLNPRLPDEIIARMKSSYGLDKPATVQFVNWITQIVRGNMGFSFIYRRPVSICLLEAFSITLIVGIPTLIYSFTLGISLGTLCARKRGGKIDKIITMLSLFIYSIPSFWLGLILILLLSYAIPAFPSSQLYSLEFDKMNIIEKFLDILRHITLPVLTLGTPLAAAIARFTRNTMVDIYNQTYIKMAKAKGLDERKIFVRHILPNALIPIITLLGLYLPVFLAGSIVVEKIFSIPGLGKLTVDAIFQRDYPLVVGATMFASFIVIAGNLMSDILYTIFDPRIRLTRSYR